MINGSRDAAFLEDKTLLEKALAGNERAFLELVSNYRTLIFQVAYRYTHSQDDAMDICQEVLMTILRKGSQYKGEAPLRAWIRTITVNTCNNAFRAKKRQKIDENQDVENLESISTEHGPEQVLEQSEHTDHLRSCLEVLPDKQRMTVILKIYEDLTLKEIAEIMKCSLGTAKSNFFHGVAKLKDCMGKVL